MTPTLMNLPYSPWSERARWALDARGVVYESRRYQPLVGELALWRLRGQATGPSSVPVLITDDGVISDSRAIAEWANRRGQGPDLFPAARADELDGIAQLADDALIAGRGRSLRRLTGDREGLGEMVPGWLRWTGPVGRGVAWVGVQRTLRKYDCPPDDVARGRMLQALDTLRERLAAAPDRGDAPRYLLGEFSWADIAAAQALAFVSPPTSGLRVGAGSRRSFTDPYIAAVSADLLKWRDALYAERRGQSAAQASSTSGTEGSRTSGSSSIEPSVRTTS